MNKNEFWDKFYNEFTNINGDEETGIMCRDFNDVKKYADFASDCEVDYYIDYIDHDDKFFGDYIAYFGLN